MGAAAEAAEPGRVPRRLRAWLHQRLPRMLPGGTPERLPVTLHRRRIYILPTRAGMFFGLLLTVLLLGALNYNNNLALMLTFLLAGVMLIAPVHTYRSLAGLRVNGCRSVPVFAGQPARFELRLGNDSRQWRCAMRARTPHDADRVDVPPSGTASLYLDQPTGQRGWIPAARTRLFSEHPMGMFHAWSWLSSPGHVLVYPAPEARPPPLPSGGDGGPGSGRTDREEEFTGLRDYRSGDPSRLIAWKALARTDKLMSKEFLAPRRGCIWLDFDALQGLPVEARLSRLTAWTLEAHRQRLDYGLSLPGRKIPPTHSEAHRLECLEALAFFRT